jgi:predicted MPP superfamily phosphohydrolase
MTSRTMGFIIFFSIFLSVYALVNYYIYIRGSQALPRMQNLRVLYTVIFVALASAYIVGRFSERASITLFSNVCIWTGSLWLSLVLYLFLSVLVLDIIRMMNFIFHFYPAAVIRNYDTVKLALMGFVVLLSSAIILAGFINAKNPVLRELSITIDKKAGGISSLRVAMVSDIHLGTIITNSRLMKIVDMVNASNPDIILLCGDIVDEDLGPVIKNNLGETLRLLKSKYGTWAVTGNHEYIGGAERAVAYLRDHNIRVLRDERTLIDDSFHLIGRDDISGARMNGGRKRKSIGELMAGIDLSIPIILMDHQPGRLTDISTSGIDLQLSGHTHAGQLWPMNYIIDRVWEMGYGYRKINGGHFYVSSGAGTWGPPVRIGNRPEVVLIRIEFSPR